MQEVRRVDIVVYPNFKSLEAIGPLSVFEYANIHLARLQRKFRYDVRIAALQAGPVRSDTVMSLEATRELNTLDLPHDAIIVGARDIETALAQCPELVHWSRAAAPRLKRFASLCSGAFFLAAAQLLDGKRATTHWSVAALLAGSFPKIDVEPDNIFVQEGNIWTSAGVTAGIDLALAFVEADLGRELALEVARDMVVYLKRPGGQSQFSNLLVSQRTSHSTIQEIQDWILAHPTEDLSVTVLAARAAMSVRNFTRVFRKEAGISCLDYVERARFEIGLQLLANPAVPLKAAALQAGFRDQEHLRRVCQKRLGITPMVYRQRFATTGVSNQAL